MSDHPDTLGSGADLADERIFDHAVHNRPYGNLRISGDLGLVIERPEGVFVAIIDVLGHGPSANTTARQIELLLTQPDLDVRDVTSVLRALHHALLDKRGCAAGLAWCDRATGKLRYTAVGNTAARCFPAVGKEVRLLSRDGTLGAAVPTPREESLTLSPGDVLVLYTDGVSDSFKLSDYPLLRGDSAEVVARTLVQRFGKTHDDATAICLRWKR